MRGFFYSGTSKSNKFQSTTLNNVTKGISLAAREEQRQSSQINRNIGKGLAILLKNNLGLQTVLSHDKPIIIDRTICVDIHVEKKAREIDTETLSSRSETNSTKTNASSTAESLKSKLSNNDLMNNANAAEDLTQKYYKDLKNSLNGCILTKKPGVFFSDIAGNSYAKQAIREALILPFEMPTLFDNGKVKPWKKLLIYGPPGVGKTMMAQAIATEIDATCFWVSLADITSKFIGESEKLLRILFELAREKQPSIIIIDEMDSIGRKRNGSESETERRIKTEFLRQMDEIGNSDDKVFVVATTNMPWELDIAALKRFERRILLPMPDLKVREDIFKLRIGGHEKLTDSDYKSLAQLTDGYSGSDISTVVNDAFMRPVRNFDCSTHFKIVKKPIFKELEGIIDNDDEKAESHEIYYQQCDPTETEALPKSSIKFHRKNVLLKDVTMQDFKDSIKNCKPTVPSTFLELYNKFLLKYGHIEQKDDIASQFDNTKISYFL